MDEISRRIINERADAWINSDDVNYEEKYDSLLRRIKGAVEEIDKELNGRVPDYEITGNLDDAWQSCAYKCSEILRKKFPEVKEAQDDTD